MDGINSEISVPLDPSMLRSMVVWRPNTKISHDQNQENLRTAREFASKIQDFFLKPISKIDFDLEV